MNSSCAVTQNGQSRHVENTEHAGKIVVRLVSISRIATISRIADVENEFPCYQKWRRTLDSHSGKVERNTDRDGALRLLCTYYRRERVSLFVSLFFSLFLSLVFYLSRALSRDVFLERQKALEREKEEKREDEQARRQRRPSIKTLKITEFLLVFRELYQRARGSEIQARVLLGICRRRKSEFADINPLFLLLGLLWSCNHAS